jgi:hypothetical protein
MSYDEVMSKIFRIEEELEEQGKDLDLMFDPSCSVADRRHFEANGGFPIPSELMEAYAVAARMERLQGR